MTDNDRAEALRLIEEAQLDSVAGPLSADQIDEMYHFTLDEVVELVRQSAPHQAAVKLSYYVNAADILASDAPHTVVEKLQAQINAASVVAAALVTGLMKRWEIYRNATRYAPNDLIDETIETLALLASPSAAASAEPVAFMYEHDGMLWDHQHPICTHVRWKECMDPWYETPLYAHPAPDADLVALLWEARNLLSLAKGNLIILDASTDIPEKVGKTLRRIDAEIAKGKLP